VTKNNYYNKESLLLLNVVDTDDLVDPTDERGNFDVDSRHLSSAATKAP